MLRKLYIYLPVVFISFCLPDLSAQIYAPTVNYSDTVSYFSTPHRDSIFIFNHNNAKIYLSANAGEDTVWNYQWAVFDTAIGYVNLPLVSDTISLLDTITVSNGYRLIQTKGNDLVSSDTFICWVMLNDFHLEIEENQRNCENLRLFCVVEKNTLQYYNPDTKKQILYTIKYPNPKAKDWFALGDESPAPPSYVEDPLDYGSTITFVANVTKQHYYETWYGVEVTDIAGLSKRDSMLFESITPKAVFSSRQIALDEELYYPNRSEDYYKNYEKISNSAPAMVLFQNTSINADSCIWNFGDSISGNSSGNDSIVYTYLYPGKYKPKGTVYKFVDFLPESEIGCISESDLAEIELANPSIELSEVILIPEYKFRFLNDVSITDFEIKIYNRIGQKLYEFTGNIRDWDGWDGTYNGGSNYVPTGVYYYVVNELHLLRTYPEMEVNFTNAEGGTGSGKGSNNVYRGFFHVFNTQ